MIRESGVDGKFISSGKIEYGGVVECKSCRKVKECSPENFMLTNKGKKSESVSKRCRNCDYLAGRDRHAESMSNPEFANRRREASKEWRSKNRHIVALKNYVAIDKKKGFVCSLTKEDVEKIQSMPCVYCGDTERIGADRIDNSTGHTLENCVPCCADCNVARSDNFTHEEMKIIGSAIRTVKRNRN